VSWAVPAEIVRSCPWGKKKSRENKWKGISALHSIFKNNIFVAMITKHVNKKNKKKLLTYIM
tara:strand:+ start:1381 stop:1566 length:186 start_codon:yes stop_codon:yes gene_type:complete